VIGVVRDLRYATLKSEPEPAVYQAFLQARTGRGQMVLHVRCAGDPETVATALRPIVAALDRQLPAFDVRSLEGEVDAVLVRERMLALLSALFGGLAVVLAAVGLYGVMAYAVGRRTKEIGIRMALGASRAEVRWLVLGEALRVVAAGLLVGLPVALGASRVLRSFLYGVDSQPLVFAGAVLILTAIAVVAGWAPARRAARVDPMFALRWE
jgi:ABC-type antimicrobial peptide transport system permease subunit